MAGSEGFLLLGKLSCGWGWDREELSREGSAWTGMRCYPYWNLESESHQWGAGTRGRWRVCSGWQVAGRQRPCSCSLLDFRLPSCWEWGPLAEALVRRHTFLTCRRWCDNRCQGSDGDALWHFIVEKRPCAERCGYTIDSSPAYTSWLAAGHLCPHTSPSRQHITPSVQVSETDNESGTHTWP